MNFKFEITPTRRLGIAFWLGTFQAIIMMTLFQSGATDDLMDIHWGFYLIIWVILGFLHVKNSLAFDKETLWMTIKNPAKVTREEDDMMTKRPGRPPPPPRPPPPRRNTEF